MFFLKAYKRRLKCWKRNWMEEEKKKEAETKIQIVKIEKKMRDEI